MKKSFNVVIATAGRDSLQAMVDSIAPQLEKQDYLTIIWDCQAIPLQINSKCQVITLQNEEPLGYWGHGSRNRWMQELPGDYFMNGDDDDVYMPGCMKKIREVCKEEKLYVFKFDYQGTTVPMYPEVKVANIGTSCGVYPKVTPFPKWEHVYGGDGMFYEALAKILPVEFVDHVIYKVTPKVSVEVMPEEPESIICSCGAECSKSLNRMLKMWEGYCNRCDRTTR